MGEPAEPTVEELEEGGSVGPEYAAKIGRYHLLEMVGMGGMGMVWGAWDPQLERRVALKLVRRMSEASQERILKEGQVLARLSHPNVVPIFDVGVAGQQVYLVMEWVRGTTLRSYAGERPGWRGVLEAYRQAGAGLDAAHQAGVIHRDFKPDNAIRGEDGRVRVLDFGLAHRSSDEIVGTPRYRSPEQVRGGTESAASDQYAFCLSLREALVRQGVVPAWLAAILDRGTDVDPARRFVSMRALLAALAHDPARRWRWAALGTIVAAAAVVAFAVGRSGGSRAPAIEPCSGAEATVSSSWNPRLRAQVEGHLGTLGLVGPDVERVLATLDRQGRGWVREHRRTCLAHARKELPRPRYEARMFCLDRSLAQLAAVGEILVEVDERGLAPALTAARSLRDGATCAETTGTVSPPPAADAARFAALAARVERAHVLMQARRPDAVDAARAAAEEARLTGYAPLIARALMVLGRASIQVGQPGEALLEESWRLALAAGDDLLALDAYARWTYALAMQGNTSVDGWAVMAELAGRLGPSGRFARALLYNNRAVVHIAGNDKVGARALLEQAAAEASDASELELYSIESNLAAIERDPVEALRLRRRASILNAMALGADHPETLYQRGGAALLVKERPKARQELESTCRAFEQWRLTSAIAMCALEAAWLADEDGDRAAAAAWMARVQETATAPAQLQVARAYAAYAAGRLDAAQRAALTELAAQDYPRWWDRRDAAHALTILALDDDADGHAAAATRAWERALALLVTVEQATDERRLARIRRLLAERWTRSRPADARRLAGEALVWYREVRGEEATVARLEAIAGKPRPP